MVSREEPAGRDRFRVWREIPTRWADNDSYGHVNNTVYYEWFDTAVNGWLIDQGMLDIAHGDPIGLVVETRCSYFSPAAFPDVIHVGLRVAHVGTSSVRYELGIFRNDETVASAQGHYVHVYVERATRRPVAAMPDDLRAALAALLVGQA